MRAHNGGFTLIELVIVIVLTGILAVVVGPLIGRGYSAVSQSSDRAFWVQQAEFAFFHLRQDLATSVPNSLRTPINGSDDQAVEFLGFSQTQSAAALRYRQHPFSGYDFLQISGDSAFDVFDTVSLTSPVYVSIGGINAEQILGDWRSSTQPGSSAQIASTTARTSCDCGDCSLCPVTTLTLAASHQFRNGSPYFRAYLTDGPVAYQCADGHLLRHSGYSNLNNTDLNNRLAGESPVTARVIDSVQSCAFDWHPGTIGQPPSLTVRLSVGNAREQVQLTDTIVLGGAP
ncbi:type II secretion system protein [Saccharospirillum mangrovi]|uniref:type II secretion system protein n=1 Tax=Saccharospirillum mangrovi TaxID=2161747 RepID=UPI000D3A4F90|nr:type II secretion system protein [Saccharospirillum mangrovi]